MFATYNNIDKWLQSSDIQPGLNAAVREGNTNRFIDGLNASHLKEIGDNLDGLPKDNSGINASENMENKTVNTRVISASFVKGTRQHVKLTEPVVFTMKHISVPVLIFTFIYLVII